MSEEESESLEVDIENEASEALATLLPEKSRFAYELAYNRFEEWRQRKKVNISEKVMLAYFFEKAKNTKSSTLWSHYSMLKTTIYMKHNIDIRKFCNLLAFLKRKSEGYRPKKSKILTRSNIERFLMEANDHDYLLLKVCIE